MNQPLYEKSQKAYPQRVQGVFRRIKWWALAALLGLYYVLPWLRWDRGPGMPDQAVLADFEGPRLYFFMIEIWPQEIYYLTGILIVGAVGLFLATGLFGRVWCGFTCPQTVWTDIFLWVERKVEGDRNTRMKLDRQPLSVEKALRKTIKHLLWVLVALATGGAFIFYFADAPVVLVEMLTGQASSTVYTFTGIFAGTTYLLAGWAREQVCLYMCPWPRFQGAMFDEDTLVVTYEDWRGEPRGKKKNADLGDCIDCNLCVNVCPTGVDIRKGQQFGCIGCALCVDACNSIMDKLERPRNLITYDSIANQFAREQGRPTSKRLLRPRILGYIAILLAVVAVMGYGLLNRVMLEINVQRDRAPLFVELSDGQIRNGFTFKLLNMASDAQNYSLTLDGLDGATFTVIGGPSAFGTETSLHVDADTVATYRIFIRMPREEIEEKSAKFEFVLVNAATGAKIEYDAKFAGPKP